MNATEPIRATRRLAPLVAAATLVFAPALAAQDPPPLGTPVPDAPRAPCVCAWEDGDAPRMLRAFSWTGAERARIGVLLGDDTEVEGRSGARVEEVVEGGPAARAGIREGDVLVSLDGAALGEDAGSRVIELLADVEPGDTVTIGFLRDGREQTARVVTDRAHGFAFAPHRGELRRSFARVAPMVEAMVAPGAHVRMRSLFGGGVELVEMNEGLGEYFGTDEGVLVADVEEDSPLGLQPGDVILSIGGRTVQDPGHARSIIASYRDDETISFEVMRERRRATVTGRRAEP